MKLSLAILLIAVSFSTWALPQQSMRRCMLLPVKDFVGGAIGFKVFEEVENYLKEGDWCYYRSNSDIIDVLGNYRKNINTHLQNPDVIRILGEKTRSGSIIRVTIESDLKGVVVSLKVIGDNGDDVYFSQRTQLRNSDITVISQTIKNWLDVYEKNIPYDARVVGVLGNQLTVDMGRSYGVIQGADVDIVRPTSRKRHPLLKEVVDWDTEKIGDGKIFHTGAVQSQGKMSQYEGRKRLKIGDWVIIKETSKNKVVENGPNNFSVREKESFGKLGTLAMFLNLGSGSDSTNVGTNEIKKIGGFLVGIDLRAELWATRHFWSSVELGRKLGSYGQKEGVLTADSNSYNGGHFKWKVGYKYLPLGFFYGPQLDGYIGYASYNHGVDTQAADGFVETTFKGLLVGARGSLPIIKNFRAMLELDFMLGPGYDEAVTVFGQDDSASNFHLGLGGSYVYSPSMTFEGGLDFVTSKAKFKAPVREASFKETGFKGGVVFNF